MCESGRDHRLGSLRPTQGLLAALGARRDRGRYRPPHRDTIERVFEALGVQALAEQLGGYLATRAGLAPVGAPIAGPVLLPAIAVDGKAVRGAVGDDGLIPYLLAAATHDRATVIAERLVGAKATRCPSSSRCLPGYPQAGGC